MNDRHGAAAENIGRAHDKRQAEFGRHQTGLFDRIGDAVLRLLEAELVEQALEAVAVFGEVDRIDRRAEDRNARLLQGVGELQRRLAAELHDHALERSIRLFRRQNLEHVLARQRLEIETVGRVVIRRHRLRIAIDHDGLVALLAQREAGVTAAIVEFDALPDAVRPTTENDDFLFVRRRRLAGGLARERPLVGRIHVGRGRREFRRAGVDALEHRTHAERLSQARDVLLRLVGERREPQVREAVGLQHPQIVGVLGQAVLAHAVFQRDNLADAGDEPRIDLAGLMNLVLAHAHAQRLSHHENAVGRRRAKRGAQHVLVVAQSQPLDLVVVEARQARLERAQRLL